jgi:general secretion pathway protein D
MPQTEAKPAEPQKATTPEAAESKESGKGDEAATEKEDESFEIDRGKNGKNGKKAKAPETAATAPLEKEKPAAREPGQKSRGFFGRLFGPGKDDSKEDKQKGADSAKAGPEQGIAAGAAAGTNGAAVERTMTPEELLAAQEEVRRQTTEVEGLKKLDQAYQAMSRKEFDKALVFFKEGLNIMPLRPHTVETRQKAMMSEGECEYRLALDNYQAGKVSEARENIRRALEYCPAHRGAARLSERIKQDQVARAEVEVKPVPLRQTKTYLDKKKQIAGEIKRGREYLAMKEYNSAEDEFRNALADDKYNSDASANLKKIGEIKYNLETDEFARLKSEMLAQIRDTWTPPVKRVTTGPRTQEQETMKESMAKRKLEQKLKDIMIQKIEFVDAKIEDVVSYLHQQSLVGDRDSAPGEKGVNILLRLSRPGQAAPAAAQATDIFAAEEAVPAASSSGTAGITMTMRDISLMDAIKYITDIAGLKYRIEERVVIIHRPDIALGELETRTYKVLPSTIDTMTGGGGGAAAPETAADRLELGQNRPTASADRTDIKQFLINGGIPFPENTSIVYIPAPPLLIVKNTSENLESFEQLLNKLNVPSVQVQIEARFVEVGQSDLKELGLEWLLTDNWELASKPNGERIQMNRNNFTKGLRELNVSGGQIGTAVGGTMGSIASISSILTNPELTVILHALEQSDGVNLLSAPKVTTKSGSNAKIKVVEELIYPTEYQQQAQSIGTTSSGNQSLIQIVVTPSAFETRDLGVILDVTPTVGPDNETIELQMLPQVVELARWIDYGSDIPTGDPNRTQHLTLNQPVFHCRDITTQISIWDGQTVVMGGLISEGQVNTEDKVPLLGDIPLLGYLFRSKTSKSVKKNLLIFVTANLVDPAGNKIKKEPAATFAGEGGSVSVTP